MCLGAGRKGAVGGQRVAPAWANLPSPHPLSFARAKARHGCLFFSWKMTAKQIGARILADQAFVARDPIFYEDVLKRKIDERQRQRLHQSKEIISQYPFIIEEQRGLTITDIAVRARKVAAKYESEGGSLEVVFVDHMLLIRPSQRYAGNPCGRSRKSPTASRP